MGIDPRTELSEFLRTRRARLRPEDVGLDDYGGRRRVPGLRREELARLAGVSVAYYTRLEQGHGGNVSTGVLDAVASALRLTGAEREHLAHLVRPARAARRAAPREVPSGARPAVRPSVQRLIDQLDSVAACVVGFRMDVLAWNRLACLLLADFPRLTPAERNMARLVFLDPAARGLFVDWESKASDVVSALRMDAGARPDDVELCLLLHDLKEGSADFAVMWERHDVRDVRHGRKRLRHPVAGELTLYFESLALPDDAGQRLVTFHAEPGSPSARALRRLAGRDAESPVPAEAGVAGGP
ncbi:helix-turn-helix transcriptional regulator [Streptomyces specialis]|uniref:helix-turn-helix transcriptional regulator n=1 Tax=Streptomyces specialis TaxID=498367 RepID=UPI00073F5339|nr:helix-turn-helix transcriptional regulator [Streptomyces specialis]